MGGVPKTSETSRAFSSALPMICSRYPLDNPHSRHRSLRESEYDQDRSTHPPTSSSLGGSRCTACIDDDRIPKQLLYGELSVCSRPQRKTVSRTH